MPSTTSTEKKLENEYKKMEKDLEEKLDDAKEKIESYFSGVASKAKSKISKNPGTAVAAAVISGLVIGWLLGRK